MTIADVDKDGLISFTEFFFFVLVVQTPSKTIKADFKKAGGKMNLQQMSNNLKNHRKKTQFGQKHDMLKRQEEDFQTTNKMMCVRIFDGKEEIGCEDYLAFRN